MKALSLLHLLLVSEIYSRLKNGLISELIYIIQTYIGNLGNLLLIIIPAICGDEGNPFGDRETCTSRGLSYASFSMAVRNYECMYYYS